MPPRGAASALQSSMETRSAVTAPLRHTIANVMNSKHRPLRRGWTTGACATAGTKAAYTAPLTGEVPDPVQGVLPRGGRTAFAPAVGRRGGDSTTAGGG